MEGASPGGAAPDGAGACGVPQEQGARLAEGLNAVRELRRELQKAKDDYNMAAGTWGRCPKPHRYRHSPSCHSAPFTKENF